MGEGTVSTAPPHAEGENPVAGDQGGDPCPPGRAADTPLPAPVSGGWGGGPPPPPPSGAPPILDFYPAPQTVYKGPSACRDGRPRLPAVVCRFTSPAAARPRAAR